MKPSPIAKVAVTILFIGVNASILFAGFGQTLWITFHKRRLIWAFLDGSKAKTYSDGEGAFRRVKDGWRDHDIFGGKLSVDKLAGSLTMVQGFQGTTCDIKAVKGIVDRINDNKSREAHAAEGALDRLTKATVGVVKRLHPKDLELLVDLIFSRSGWRRISPMGKTEKGTDMDLILPTTGDRAFVQVKSKTNQHEFDGYEALIKEPDSGYARMFYVYHTGQVRKRNEKVSLIDAKQLALMVREAGLTQWVIDKAS